MLKVLFPKFMKHLHRVKCVKIRQVNFVIFNEMIQHLTPLFSCHGQLAQHAVIHHR